MKILRFASYKTHINSIENILHPLNESEPKDCAHNTMIQTFSYSVYVIFIIFNLSG